jgi:hypothetical protein
LVIAAIPLGVLRLLHHATGLECASHSRTLSDSHSIPAVWNHADADSQDFIVAKAPRGSEVARATSTHRSAFAAASKGPTNTCGRSLQRSPAVREQLTDLGYRAARAALRCRLSLFALLIIVAAGDSPSSTGGGRTRRSFALWHMAGILFRVDPRSASLRTSRDLNTQPV